MANYDLDLETYPAGPQKYFKTDELTDYQKSIWRELSNTKLGAGAPVKIMSAPRSMGKTSLLKQLMGEKFIAEQRPWNRSKTLDTNEKAIWDELLDESMKSDLAGRHVALGEAWNGTFPTGGVVTGPSSSSVPIANTSVTTASAGPTGHASTLDMKALIEAMKGFGPTLGDMAEAAKRAGMSANALSDALRQWSNHPQPPSSKQQLEATEGNNPEFNTW